jgi:hypothetical protein
VTTVGFGLAALTTYSKDWIEAISGTDPDRGNGSLEWSLSIALIVVGLAAAYLARNEWRQRKLAAEG